MALPLVHLPVTQKLLLTASPINSDGSPSEVEAGSYRWEIGPEGIQNGATLQPSDNTCWVIPTGVELGHVYVYAYADADPGSGVSTIQGVHRVNVYRPLATSLTVEAGAPVPIAG